MAAKVLNVEQVPVDYQPFDNEAEEYAHLIADNRIAELAEADKSELAKRGNSRTRSTSTSPASTRRASRSCWRPRRRSKWMRTQNGQGSRASGEVENREGPTMETR